MLWRHCPGLLLILLLVPLARAIAAPPEPAISLEAPRPFGYLIGDLIEHRIKAQVAAPYFLERGFLPSPGPIGNGLEIRAIDVQEDIGDSAHRYQIRVRYQVFKGVRETEQVTIPPLPLRFQHDGKSLTAASPAWEFTLAPLIPPDTPDAALTIRPPREPVAMPLTGHWWLLASVCASILLCLGYLLWYFDLLPAFSPHPGPFARACRKLRQLRRQPDSGESYRQGLKIFHRAVDETAGATVFAEQLEEFFRKHPGYRKLQDRTEVFYSVSRAEFFDTGAKTLPATDRFAWLEALCHDFRRLERELR